MERFTAFLHRFGAFFATIEPGLQDAVSAAFQKILPLPADKNQSFSLQPLNVAYAHPMISDLVTRAAEELAKRSAAGWNSGHILEAIAAHVPELAGSDYVVPPVATTGQMIGIAGTPPGPDMAAISASLASLHARLDAAGTPPAQSAPAS